MTISLSDAGKRFNRDWIFRHFNFEFKSGHSYAITGPNGSGKSTLLQAIAGAISLSEGKISYTNQEQQTLGDSDFYPYISIATPYLEVIEELTLTEFLNFHHGFKSLLNGFDSKRVIQEIQLPHAADKQIRYFSSGMKQRVKLAQAFFSDTPIVLLDEPCTNLDATGIALYQQLVERFCKGRTVIVSSNDTAEFAFCEERISMEALKTSTLARNQ